MRVVGVEEVGARGIGPRGGGGPPAEEGRDLAGVRLDLLGVQRRGRNTFIIGFDLERRRPVQRGMYCHSIRALVVHRRSVVGYGYGRLADQAGMKRGVSIRGRMMVM